MSISLNYGLSLIVQVLLLSPSNALTKPQELTPKSSNKYSYCLANKPWKSKYKPIEKASLLSVHLVTRHGDRAPINFLPIGYEKDPWYCSSESTQIIDNDPNHSFIHRTTIHNQDLCTGDDYCSINDLNPMFRPGNCSDGQLTPKGIRMLYDLGKNLKDIYVTKLGFVNADWKKSQQHIFVRSSEVWRTQQSATSLISGMFHSSISPISNLNIYTMPKEIETIVSNSHACPKIGRLEKEMKRSEMYEKNLLKAQPLKKKFDDVLKGTVIGRANDTLSYYVDIFQSRQCHQFPKVCRIDNPKHCITKSMIDQMMELGNIEYEIYYRDHPANFPVASRLRIGEILLEMKRNILQAIAAHSGKKVIKQKSQSVNRKFIYYSAHDTTIAPLLGALQSARVEWPPYASNFITELWTEPHHSTSSNPLSCYQLRFIYNGEPVITPWCPTGQCSLPQFLRHLDFKLGIVGGFENYGVFKKSKGAPPIWNILTECWSE